MARAVLLQSVYTSATDAWRPLLQNRILIIWQTVIFRLTEGLSLALFLRDIDVRLFKFITCWAVYCEPLTWCIYGVVFPLSNLQLASALLLAFGITAKASPSSITTIFSYIIDDQSKQYITNCRVQCSLHDHRWCSWCGHRLYRSLRRLLQRQMAAGNRKIFTCCSLYAFGTTLSIQCEFKRRLWTNRCIGEHPIRVTEFRDRGKRIIQLSAKSFMDSVECPRKVLYSAPICKHNNAVLESEFLATYEWRWQTASRIFNLPKGLCISSLMIKVDRQRYDRIMFTL
jgi:hypothetical protein